MEGKIVYYLYNRSLDPYFNLALEEYFLTNFKDEFFIVWRNDNCIVVGKNQNTYSEINSDYVSENGIKVVRRLTGGGAVYHDKGNINFTFIKNSDAHHFSFNDFLEPIVNFLKTLDIDAKVSGRNDIVIDDKKISGNAQTILKGRILHHGTLLYSSDIKNISGALNVAKEKYETKAVKSVEKRVTNICDNLKERLTVEEFIEQFSRYISSNMDIKEYKLTKKDISEIQKLADNKYSKFEWNFGISPKFKYRNIKRFPQGLIEVYLQVENSIINNVKIYGDFFSMGDIKEIEDVLKGCIYKKSEIKNRLNSLDFNKYFMGISLDDFITVFNIN